MDGDFEGNLVISGPSDEDVLWISDTGSIGTPGHYLRLEANGNLVIYDGDDRPIWETDTDGGNPSEHQVNFPGEGKKIDLQPEYVKYDENVEVHY